jgi:hypothetical protein
MCQHIIKSLYVFLGHSWMVLACNFASDSSGFCVSLVTVFNRLWSLIFCIQVRAFTEGGILALELHQLLQPLTKLLSSWVSLSANLEMKPRKLYAHLNFQALMLRWYILFDCGAVDHVLQSSEYGCVLYIYHERHTWNPPLLQKQTAASLLLESLCSNKQVQTDFLITTAVKLWCSSTAWSLCLGCYKKNCILILLVFVACNFVLWQILEIKVCITISCLCVHLSCFDIWLVLVLVTEQYEIYIHCFA